jgi:hypothetical protein
LVGGVLLGGLVWLLINIFSAIIFRKTSDQSVGVVRVIFGGLGACLGLVSGCLILALGAWAVRWVGSVQEGMHTSLSPRKKPGSPNAGESSPETLFTTLKSALDHSSTGNLLKSLDPIAPDKYRLLAKMGQIAADPAALERLMAQPNLQPLLHNANVRALRSDTELRDAIQEKDIWKILQNPRIQAAARDSQILHVLRSLNLEKALNEALAGPVSGGVESPKTPGAPEKKRVPPR